MLNFVLNYYDHEQLLSDFVFVYNPRWKTCHNIFVKNIRFKKSIHIGNPDWLVKKRGYYNEETKKNHYLAKISHK